MAEDLINSFMTGPDEQGRFGKFGGRFVSETLMPLILSLEEEYEKATTDHSFWDEMDHLWKRYVGRPSPLYFAERLTERLGGANKPDVTFRSEAMTIPSEANKPTQVPALLMASMAYST